MSLQNNLLKMCYNKTQLMYYQLQELLQLTSNNNNCHDQTSKQTIKTRVWVSVVEFDGFWDMYKGKRNELKKVLLPLHDRILRFPPSIAPSISSRSMFANQISATILILMYLIFCLLSGGGSFVKTRTHLVEYSLAGIEKIPGELV